MGDSHGPRQTSALEVSTGCAPCSNKVEPEGCVCVSLEVQGDQKYKLSLAFLFANFTLPFPTPIHRMCGDTQHLILVSSIYPFLFLRPPRSVSFACSPSRFFSPSLSPGVYVCEHCQGWQRTSHRV